MIDGLFLHRILEGALFASEEPLSLDQLLLLFQEHERPDKSVLIDVMRQLQEQYSSHGIELVELASGYQFQVRKDLAPWVRKLWEEKPPRYSRAAMETLALVAYRQPITRAEIENVRGVTIHSQIFRSFMEHGWVRVVGHKEVPGRPALYATTKQFLDHFGLKNLEELPTLQEFMALEAKVGNEIIEEQNEEMSEDPISV